MTDGVYRVIEDDDGPVALEPISDDPYAHWNEEGPIIRAAENDYSRPDADMTDAEIKQAVYDRYDRGEEDWPEAYE